MDGAVNTESQVRRQFFDDAMKYNDRDLRAMGPVFYVFLSNEQMEKEIDETIVIMDKVFSKEYGRNMEGFAKNFVVTVGEDGSVAGFAGSLVDMARVNSGDSDLAKELGVDSAEDASQSNA